MGKYVNTIKGFINLLYRKPKVTRGNGHHLPEQQGGYLDKKRHVARKINYYLVLQCPSGRGGKSVTVSIHFPGRGDKQSLTLKATKESSNCLNPPK